VNENVLARRLLAQPQFRNRYYQQLVDASTSAMEKEEDAPKDSSGPGWLEREVTRMAAQIRSLARSDTFKPFSNGEFETSLNDLLIFARERADFVRARVAEQRR
jgi:hypothetical protein